MSEISEVYQKMEALNEKVIMKIDSNHEKFIDRMSTTELKIALLENISKPHPDCSNYVKGKVKATLLRNSIVWTLISVVMLGSYYWTNRLWETYEKSTDKLKAVDECLTQDVNKLKSYHTDKDHE